MPRLWNNTIEAHRRAVHDAILEAAAALVARNGLTSVTMSQIAEEAGIGRATLYKYYPDIESILMAWHERLVSAHVSQLAELRDQAGDALERLRAVLEGAALNFQSHHGSELAALLHRGGHVVRAQRHLLDMLRDLIAEGAETGEIRQDVSADELARYCLHALTAASSLSSRASVRRLVVVTLSGLRPHPSPSSGSHMRSDSMPRGRGRRAR